MVVGEGMDGGERDRAKGCRGAKASTPAKQARANSWKVLCNMLRVLLNAQAAVSWSGSKGPPAAGRVRATVRQAQLLWDKPKEGLAESYFGTTLASRVQEWLPTQVVAVSTWSMTYPTVMASSKTRRWSSEDGRWASDPSDSRCRTERSKHREIQRYKRRLIENQPSHHEIHSCATVGRFPATGRSRGFLLAVRPRATLTVNHSTREFDTTVHGRRRTVSTKTSRRHWFGCCFGLWHWP